MNPSIFHTTKNTPAQLEEVDLEELYAQQVDAEASYDTALLYKSFGFRDRAIIEFYKLCDQRTVYSEKFAALLVPQLFH